MRTVVVDWIRFDIISVSNERARNVTLINIGIDWNKGLFSDYRIELQFIMHYNEARAENVWLCTQSLAG